MQAERQRHNKYKKQEEEREVIRQGIRDKVSQKQLVYCVPVPKRFESEPQNKLVYCVPEPQRFVSRPQN